MSYCCIIVKMSLIYRELVIIGITLFSLILASYGCEVEVAENKLKGKTYMPHNSSLLINCTLDSIARQAAWSIILSGLSNPRPVQFENSLMLLNNRGFYSLSEITSGDQKIIRLLVNTTEGNNGTMIRCIDTGTAYFISKTTIMIFDKILVDFDGMPQNAGVQMVNISWNILQHYSTDAPIMYILSVRQQNAQPQLLDTNQSNYVYTAPKDAPPCEVYNFSVTATYIGATYTGAGCSVPSTVLSTMLPSLPDIHDLQSSLQFSLEKVSNYVKLSVNFKPATFCSDYPVLMYTLKVKGQSPNDVMSSVSTNNSITINNLKQDSNYTFRIVAMNALDFGIVSSNESRIYTTDVQTAMIKLLISEASTLTIQCTFISGSDARGCLVEMIDQYRNSFLSTNVAKINSTLTSVESNLSVTNYRPFCDNHVSVVAYDIKADGRKGKFGVPGSFQKGSGTDAALRKLCDQNSGSLIPQSALVIVYALLVVVFTSIIFVTF